MRLLHSDSEDDQGAILGCLQLNKTKQCSGVTYIYFCCILSVDMVALLKRKERNMMQDFFWQKPISKDWSGTFLI